MRLSKLLWFLIPLGLLISGVAVATQITVPSATQLGDTLSGKITGQYQVMHPCSDGQVFAASSTSSTGWACTAVSGASGITSLNGLTGGTQTFSTTSQGTLFNIISSGSNHQFIFPANLLSTTTAAATYQLIGNYLTASSTLTAGGVATFSPNITLSTTTDTNLLLSIVCSTSTCTFNPAWTGTLAAGRLNSNVVQGVSTTSNSSTFTASVSAQNLAINFPNNLLSTTTAAATYVTAVTGSGNIASSGGLTPNITFTGVLPVASGGTGALNLTAADVLFGNGTNPVGTSSNFTFTTATNNLFSTNATHTNFTLTNIFYTPAMANGCLQVSSGIATSTGTNCGSGGGGTISTSTNAIIGHEANWTGLATLGNGAILDNGTVAGINATSSSYSFYDNGSLGITGNVNVATGTANDLMAFDANKNITVYGGASNCASGQAVYGISATGATTCGANGLQAALTNPVTGTGTNGQVAYYTGATSLTSGADLLNNGTIVGINASSSSYSLNVQGATNVNPFNVASSSGVSDLTVISSGYVGIGSTTPTANLVVQGTSTQTTLFIIASSTGSSLITMGTSGTNGQQLSVNSSTTVNSVVYIGGSTNNPTFPLFTVATSSGVTYMQLDKYGHIGYGGSLPTLTSCNTGTVLANSTDVAGAIIPGSAQTTCTINFQYARTNTPFCTVTEESGTAIALVASPTPTSLVITGTTIGGDTISYHCDGE
jgi:hypothetical protein